MIFSKLLKNNKLFLILVGAILISLMSFIGFSFFKLPNNRDQNVVIVQIQKCQYDNQCNRESFCFEGSCRSNNYCRTNSDCEVGGSCQTPCSGQDCGKLSPEDTCSVRTKLNSEQIQKDNNRGCRDRSCMPPANIDCINNKCKSF